MEGLKTVVCTHQPQEDKDQDFLCFCAGEMSQPVCLRVCVCVCVSGHPGSWVTASYQQMLWA